MSAEIAIRVLLGIAAASAVLSALGVLLAPDVYQRLQFMNPAGSVGAAAVAAAILVRESVSQAGSKVILTALVIFFMNPILTHATARAARIREHGRWQAQPRGGDPAGGRGGSVRTERGHQGALADAGKREPERGVRAPRSACRPLNGNWNAGRGRPGAHADGGKADLSTERGPLGGMPVAEERSAGARERIPVAEKGNLSAECGRHGARLPRRRPKNGDGAAEGSGASRARRGRDMRPRTGMDRGASSGAAGDGDPRR